MPVLRDLLNDARISINSLGFNTRSPKIFTKVIGDNVLGWIGLNTATTVKGTIEVNPVIGVRHQSVETLVAELCNSEIHPYIPPTVSGHLGYLMPERRFVPWLFGSGQSTTVLDLSDAIERWGMPFMLSNSTLDNLRLTLERWPYGVKEYADYRLPVCLFLAGELEEARKYIRVRLESLKGRSDLAAQRYSQFAGSLIERLS